MRQSLVKENIKRGGKLKDGVFGGYDRESQQFLL